MKLLALALLFALASADPVAINWTGAPSIGLPSCPSCSGGITIDTTSGATATLDLAGPGAPLWNVDSEYDFTAQFTIDAPAEIALFSTGTYSIGPSVWGDPYDYLSARFAGGFYIADENGKDVDSGGAEMQGECDGADCLLDLTGGGGQEKLLDAGTYTIIGDITDSNTGVYLDSSWTLDVTLTDPPVSAVPEPRIGVLWLAVGLVGLLARRRKT